ncbi:hypothetical protein F4861DRAFT_550233 [Xylaria intraflava]|nr:hypothetical protein F4861DRAFT_550233 [Xylaria intraflava]
MTTMFQVCNKSSVLAEADEAYDDAKTNHGYRMMRDCFAGARLTGQHYLWKDIFGYLIYPGIPVDRADLKIADIATGNGIWLYDLAGKMPKTCEFHGFDVSLDQVTPKPWLQPNVQMHTWDIFEEPSSQFESHFDIIHVRLITLVVKNQDPRPVLANLTKMLIDMTNNSMKVASGVSGENLSKLFSQINVDDRWKGNFAQIMDENGYTGSSLYVYEAGLNVARLLNDMYLGVWKEITTNMLKAPEVSRALEQRSMEEVRNGAAIIYPQLVWVGKKV